ncbi:MAG: hypothetical protein WCD66_04300, partial [Rhodanobacteraceae bacterium]
ALLQGIDIVAQQFGWPVFVQRGITLALALGFFIALLLAWYHGDQGRQRVSGTELLLIALLLGFGGGFLWWVAGPPGAQTDSSITLSAPSPAGSAESPPAVAAVPATVPNKSVAVLPFANESGDKDEQFFSDGLTEDLITALSQFAGLKVINRNSSFHFRNSSDSVAAIAARLGVAHLLQGGVRRLGQEVRIRAELVDAADGSTVWSQHYDRPYKDLFKLQDDITRSVADALKARLLEQAVQSDRPPSGNLAAYEAYLKAIAQPKTQAGVRQAIALFQQAIRIDPAYAQAYARLSWSWSYLAAALGVGDAEIRQSFDRARAAADKALRLQPNSVAAHFSRAFILLNADLDWQGTLSESRAMTSLAPDDRSSQNVRSQILTALGHPRQSEAANRKVIALDPLSGGVYEQLALDLRAQGRLDASVAALHKAIELAPGDSRLHANLALVELLRGDRTAALKAARGEAPGFWRDFADTAVLQSGPDRRAADAALAQMVEQRPDSGAYQIAELYALREEPDQMFEWLDRSWAQRDPGIQHLLTDPFVLRYKDDPRFAAYCRKVGLPVPDGSVQTAG